MSGASVDVSYYSQLAAVNLITGTTVNGLLFGVGFTLYCFCVRLLYRQVRQDLNERRQRIGTVVFVSLVVVSQILDLVLSARACQVIYAYNGSFPGGGPYAYYTQVYQRQPIAVVGVVNGLVYDLLTLGVQIWRLWVVWSSSAYAILIVVVPIVLFLALWGTQITQMIGILHGKSLVRGAYVVIPIFQSALMLVITLWVTCFIIGRIEVIRRRHIQIMGKSDIASQYTTILTMLLESFALDTVWMLLMVIFVGLRATGSHGIEVGAHFIMGSQYPIRLIAYLLVVYRVAMGRGWKKETEQKLTSLRWNRNEEGTSESTI